MRDQRLYITDIVKHIDDATLGALNVPEFQRKFVWPPSKVSALVDSLWRGYPIGILLVWESAYDSPQSALSAQGRKLWIVDGQQRVTSLALLFGKKPYWWSETTEWNKFYEAYDVLVDLAKPTVHLEFGLPNPIRRKSPHWVSVRLILNSPNLSELAQEVADKLGDRGRFAEVHEKIQSVRNVGTLPLYEIIIDHELEDVAEIFRRLNTAGTKIRDSDIIVAQVAAKQQGWIREKFNPFLKDLETSGFAFDPGVLVRALAIIGHGSARLRDVPRGFWDASAQFDKYWDMTRTSIAAVVKNLMEYGILSSDLLPSLNVLIPVFALRALYPQTFDFKKALRWMLIATRDGRYSGSAITALDQDIRQVREKATFEEAIDALAAQLNVEATFAKEDFQKEYTDKFSRLMLYLTVFSSGAMDWVNKDVRIGFDKEDGEFNKGFKPEWHHVFPRKVLKDKYDEKDIESIANIVVLNEKANKSFGSKLPERYLTDYNVSQDRLAEQAIPAKETLVLDRYQEFLDARAEILAQRATKLLGDLAG